MTQALAISGWTANVIVPASQVEAAYWQSIYWTVSSGILLLAFGLAIAWLLSSKIAISIKSLASRAEDLGLGKPAAANNLPSSISEIHNLRESFSTAARLIQERTDSLRQVSERLELAQQAASIGAFERDLVTNEIKWSTSQEKVYGLEPGSFSGKHEDWAKRVHPEDITAVEAAIRHAAETITPIDLEFRIIRPDGEVRWVVSQARIFADDTGRANRMVGVNMDITERKQLEAEREDLLTIAEQSRADAEKANHAKDEFLAMLGHELRNPLGIISTAVQLLRKTGPPEPLLQELRDTIERQVEQIARLIDDLLDISRIARGKIVLDKKPCDLTAIVRNTVEDKRVQLEESNLHLVLDLPDPPLWATVDRTRLAQIVGNLLQNAIKFTDSGGHVTVTLTESASARVAVLTVRDTGIGIEPDMLARLFDPFIQAENSIARSQGGLGLGLAMVKGLVEMHGGTVEASSAGLGQGSEFTIQIPLDTFSHFLTPDNRCD